MKVALVHDYIKEFGGAERVLKTLSEMYPDAPIYTAFSIKNSTAEKEFRGRKIIESRFAPLIKIGKLYSPLRFLTPLIWGSFDLSKYDLVITSCSWYITRGFKVRSKNLPAGRQAKVVAYCHTPPRWLYGYETSVGFTKYWPVKVYSAIVGHFMRIYDFNTAQKIDNWIANSKNVAARIEKFYRKKATVIYPPVDVENIQNLICHPEFISGSKILKQVQNDNDGYFLIVSRLVGAKGLEETAKAFKDSVYKLKIVGEAAGYSDVAENLKKISGGNIELLGRVSDTELYRLYAKAKGFIALARDEDFGITPVEAMAAGTPVIAFNGGGFKESVIEGKTGILIKDTSVKTIAASLVKFKSIKWNYSEISKYSQKFSTKRFVKEIKEYLSELH